MSRSLVLIIALVVAAAGLVAMWFVASERDDGARVSAGESEVVTPEDPADDPVAQVPIVAAEPDAGERVTVAPPIEAAGEAQADAPHEMVDVRVLHADGRPAEGVAVDLVPIDALGDTTTIRGTFFHPWMTDADGLARLRAPKAGWLVAARVVGGTPVAATASDVDGETTITLPPVGSLVVRGAPPDSMVVLALAGEWDTLALVRAGEDGAYFRAVALGLRFRATTADDDTRLTASGDGPVRAGTTATLDLELERPTVLRFRPLRADGGRVSGSIVAHADDVDTRCKRRDGGAYEVSLSPERLSGEEPNQVLLTTLKGRRSNSAWSTTTTIDPLQLGLTIDLGDVVFEQRPPLFEGVVVGPDGEPVDRAFVKLLRLAKEDEGMLGIGGGSIKTWGEQAAYFRTEEDGRFTLRADPEFEARYRHMIVVTARGFSDGGGTMVEEGSGPLTIRMSAGGRLSVDVKGVPRSSIDLLDMWLESEAGDTDLGRVWTNLDPGRYTLRVELLDVELIQLENLVVQAGEDCDDERLDRLDLSDRVEWRTLRVLDAAGNPAREITLAWSERETGPIGYVDGWELDSRDGRISAPYFDGMPVRLLVQLPGHAPMSVRDAKDGAEIRLELEKSD